MTSLASLRVPRPRRGSGREDGSGSESSSSSMEVEVSVQLLRLRGAVQGEALRIFGAPQCCDTLDPSHRLGADHAESLVFGMNLAL
ncbi:hypothetical protein AK812_SmicGene47886, partial [Symbiodinium microadriaticum]